MDPPFDEGTIRAAIALASRAPGRLVHRRLEEVSSDRNQDLVEGVRPGDYALVVSVMQRIATNLGCGIRWVS